MGMAAGARLAGILSRFSKGVKAGSDAAKLGVNAIDDATRLGKAAKLGYGLGNAYENEVGSFLMGAVPNIAFPIVYGENPIRATVNGLISQGITSAIAPTVQRVATKYGGETAGNIARYGAELVIDPVSSLGVDMVTSAIVPRQMPQQAQPEPQQQQQQQIQQIGPPGIPAYDQQRIQSEIKRKQDEQMVQDFYRQHRQNLQQDQFGTYY